MKIVILYREKSEQGSIIDQLLRDINMRDGHGIDIEKIDIDTRRGAEMAESYGVMDYPAILALSSTGQLQKDWQRQLPVISELLYYAHL
jgi:hypothetical protein